MRILCVEDDVDSRQMITALLGQAGYDVAAVGSVTEGLELAKQGDFALIILDVLYGEGSGIELCRQIRAFDARTPIVFYSGAAYEDDIRTGKEAGAQGYIVKPEIDALKRIIQLLTTAR
jgi:DNA-binding response OmpR family regulator